MSARDHCGYEVPDKDGDLEPCGRPATGWRWYQDVEHEDLLEAACDWHSNEGGRRMAELRDILDDLVDRSPCHYDHHGYCQAHGWLDETTCPHARAVAVLAGES